MRCIVLAIVAHTYNLTKWLTKKFDKLLLAEAGFSVKKSPDFIARVRNTTLQQGEILVFSKLIHYFLVVLFPRP